MIINGSPTIPVIIETGVYAITCWVASIQKPTQAGKVLMVDLEIGFSMGSDPVEAIGCGPASSTWNQGSDVTVSLTAKLVAGTDITLIALTDCAEDFAVSQMTTIQRLS